MTNAPAQQSSFSFGNAIKIVEILGLAIGVYIVLGFLKKMNIFGKSEATKQAELLGSDISVHDTVTNNISDPNNDFTKAIHAKFGAKPTKKQMLSLLPNFNNMPALMSQIISAHNRFTPNDAGKILGAFKQFHSQYETNFFTTMFSLAQKTDMYAKLNDLMHDSDMAILRADINTKPLI